MCFQAADWVPTVSVEDNQLTMTYCRSFYEQRQGKYNLPGIGEEEDPSYKP